MWTGWGCRVIRAHGQTSTLEGVWGQHMGGEVKQEQVWDSVALSCLNSVT